MKSDNRAYRKEKAACGCIMNVGNIIVSFIFGISFGIALITITFYYEAHEKFENKPDITLQEWYGFKNIKGK